MDRERIIVLKKTVYRDSDLIIRGLNSQGAKLSFIAPAALKSRRRFGGGVLEPTNFIEVVYQRSSRSSSSSSSSSFSSASLSSPFSSGASLSSTSDSASPISSASLGATPQSFGTSSWGLGSSSGSSASSSSVSMPRLQEAQIIKEFQGLRRSYELIQVGLSLLELVDRISHDGIEHGEDLFNLLGHGLQCLTQIEESALISFRLQFLLKFLFQQGVLEREPWMDPFLRVPLRDHSVLVQELQRQVEDPQQFQQNQQNQTSQPEQYEQYNYQYHDRHHDQHNEQQTECVSSQHGKSEGFGDERIERPYRKHRDQSAVMLDRLMFIEKKVKTYIETGSLS